MESIAAILTTKIKAASLKAFFQIKNFEKTEARGSKNWMKQPLMNSRLTLTPNMRRNPQLLKPFASMTHLLKGVHKSRVHTSPPATNEMSDGEEEFSTLIGKLQMLNRRLNVRNTQANV